jgi:O-antigen/teichoic acid export membrane protein
VIKKIIYSNTAWSIFSNGLIALLGFINLGFIARQYSQPDAGKWFMLLTAYTLLEMLRSGWVQTPFVRFYILANNRSQQLKLIAAAWQLLLAFTLLLSVILIPIIIFVTPLSPAFELAKSYTLLWLISALPYQLVQWQLQAKSLFKKLAIVRLVFPLCFTAVLLMQARFNVSIHTLVLLYAVIQFLAGLVAVFCGWLQFGTWHTKLASERKKLSNFGKYSMLTMVTASLLRSSDQFLIATWLGPAAVAMYAIPQKLIEAIEIPVRSFASIAAPKATTLFNNNQFTTLRTFFYRQCGTLLAIILPLILLFFFFPTFIVNLLGGSKYQSSSFLLQLFCGYAILIPLDRYCGVLLDAGNRPQKNTLKVVLMLLINIVGDIAALHLGAGIYGVAAVSTVTFLFGIIVGWYQLKDILQTFSASLLWQQGIIYPIKAIKK